MAWWKEVQRIPRHEVSIIREGEKKEIMKLVEGLLLSRQKEVAEIDKLEAKRFLNAQIQAAVISTFRQPSAKYREDLIGDLCLRGRLFLHFFTIPFFIFSTGMKKMKAPFVKLGEICGNFSQLPTQEVALYEVDRQCQQSIQNYCVQVIS